MSPSLHYFSWSMGKCSYFFASLVIFLLNVRLLVWCEQKNITGWILPWTCRISVLHFYKHGSFILALIKNRILVLFIVFTVKLRHPVISGAIPKCIKQDSDAILYLLCSWQELDICSVFSKFQLLFSTRFLGVFLCIQRSAKNLRKIYARIWGLFPFGSFLPRNFPFSLYSSSGSLNSALWHPNLRIQQIFLLE